MIEERDIIVAMRDGTRLAVDVYRPDEPGKYPVLYASRCTTRTFRVPTSPTSCRRSRRMRRCGSVRSRRATRGASSPTATST